jgi:hypothetical protein
MKMDMATITPTSNDIKKDVQELVSVVTEDNISESKIRGYYEMYHKYGSFENSLKHDIAVADITGTSTVSRRFGEKFLSILSKYKNKEQRLVVECTEILTRTRQKAKP